MERSCIWNFKPVKTGNKLPKSWEEFCEMFPVKKIEYYTTGTCELGILTDCERNPDTDRDLFQDAPTAYAVIALCQLIQLRNCYNGDWVPDWNSDSYKFVIEIYEGHPKIWIT